MANVLRPRIGYGNGSSGGIREDKMMDHLGNLVRGALYHAAPNSGTTVEEARGVVVGVVTCLMEFGESFESAVELVREGLPDDFRMSAIPRHWQDRFV
jgi:hypothetical protein